MLQPSATVAHRSIAACIQGNAAGALVPETHDRPVNGGEEAASPDMAQPWIPIRPFVVGHVPRKMEWCVDDEKSPRWHSGGDSNIGCFRGVGRQCLYEQW